MFLTQVDCLQRGFQCTSYDLNYTTLLFSLKEQVSWLTCCNESHTTKLCQYAVTKLTRGKMYIFYSNSTLSTFSTQGIWLLTLSVSQYAIAEYAPNKSVEHRTRKSIAFRCCTTAIFYVFSLLFVTVRVLACANARSAFLFLPYCCPEGLHCHLPSTMCRSELQRNAEQGGLRIQ